MTKEKIADDKFSISSKKGGFKVLNISSPDDRNKIINNLKNENIQFFTFTPKNEKPLNLILKGIDHSFDENDITVALHKLSINIKVNSVFKMPSSNFYSTLWIVSITPGSDVNSLLNIKYMLHHAVSFSYKKK